MASPNQKNQTLFMRRDDFGVKYFSKDDIQHLLNVLKNNYEVTIDWTGADYCGLNIEWNYDKGWVYISIPNYIKKMLSKLNHPPPKKTQHVPHKWAIPIYGKKVQLVPGPDNTEPLDKKGQKRVQSTTGTLLYYARAIDTAILPVINDKASIQAHPTEKKQTKQ